MFEETISNIQFEIEELDRLLQTYKDLLTKAEQTEPNLVEVTAMGTVLHSFYTGLENIFSRLCKDIDGTVPSQNQWHRDLLKQVSEPTKKRRAIISQSLAERLTDYLSFRHFFSPCVFIPFRVERT